MSPAERAGLSPNGLANIERLLSEKYLDTGCLPGALTHVWRRGALAYSSALGFMDLTRTRLAGSVGEFFWGGSATTTFWIDPTEDMAVVFMTQVNNSPWRIPARRDLRTLICSAFTQSFA